ncbi:hypothetical protein BC941DRAFT_414707 [Chlamydoabsidia padenii]|nr:hypothetical protein BC941DRAFT_414707 [Chlamydoabsidia padenii]
MQWRVFTLLLAGIGVIYLASKLQDNPYPHPAKIRTSDRIHYPGLVPDTTLLSVQPDYLYEAMFYYGQSQRDQVISGTGDMKTGVFGKVRLMRKPIRSLLQHQNEKAPGDEWTTVWEHALTGPITKVSGPPSTRHSPLQFALLYHTVENEFTRYYIRVYYLSKELGSFEYKDLVLPGTTWVKSFTLENDRIIFSRDPDVFQYRIIALPCDLTSSPHSTDAQDIILSSSKPGNPISPNYQSTDQVEKHENVLSQLYSPTLDTLRVISLDAYKTRDNFYVTVSVADNASTITQLSMLRGEKPTSTWQLRTHKTAEASYNEDDFFDTNGVLDIPLAEDNRARMPPVILSRSIDAKTVAFPITRTQFTTLDYMDNISIILEQNNKQKDGLYRNDEGVIIPEYYYWPRDEHQEIYDVYDGDIFGLEVNDDGNLLAVWTEHNFIYIYKRGTGDDHVLHDSNINGEDSTPSDTTSDEVQKAALPIKSLSLIDQLDVLLGFRLPPPTASQSHHHPDLPPRWFLRMVITPNNRSSRQARISTVAFVNATTSGHHDRAGDNYLLVASKTGAVQSYLIDTIEPPGEIGLGSFITGQWDMLIAMCVIIAVFVFNEYQHYSDP